MAAAAEKLKHDVATRVRLPKNVTISTKPAPVDMSLEQMENEIIRLNSVLADMRSSFDATDTVTGLPRRARFMELASAEFNRTRRYEHDLTLVVAGVPGFERIKKAMGKDAANQTIQAVAEICASSTRFGVDILGRIDDDKIAMLLPETDLNGGNDCLKRMRKLVSAMPITIEGEKVKVGLNISARPLMEKHTSFVELLVAA